MRIAFRYGHNPACQGASGLVNEVTEDRKYGARVIQLLQGVGNQCFDCTPPAMSDSGSELVYGTNHERAISPTCDLFLSFHINSASFTAHGAEMLISDTNSKVAYTASNRILANLQAIGIYNRGVKCTGSEFNDIRESNAQAIILEPFFLTNADNVKIYQTNFEGFCRAIANGIDSRVALNPTPEVAGKPVDKDREFNISMTANIQDIGLVQTNGINSCKIGTEGKSKRLEMFSMSISNVEFTYQVHEQDLGDSQIVSEGQVLGSIGVSKRIEGITINVTKIDSPYKLQYRCHLAEKGWTDFVDSGAFCGTKNEGRRVEAIEIKIVKK